MRKAANRLSGENLKISQENHKIIKENVDLPSSVIFNHF